MAKTAVIGSGSFGTALAISLAECGHDVRLWARREEIARVMTETRQNPSYLPGAILPDNIFVTTSLEACVENADVWLIATPSQAVRAVAEQLEPFSHPGLMVVSVAKGIENGTLLTTTCVLHDTLPRVPLSGLAVLYGPSHAEEVAKKVPTAVVVAAYDLETAGRIQQIFMSPTLRVYVNDDVRGVEIAGSVKNILALAAGMSDGVGFGDNAKAALMTRGIAEIRRLGIAMGANPRTFAGLAGIGDLIVTCMSGLSRNRNLGEKIGQGMSLEDAEAEMTMVAEGVRTTASVHDLAKKLGVEMPITEAVYCILFRGKSPIDAVRDLMMRSAKHEEWLSCDES